MSEQETWSETSAAGHCETGKTMAFCQREMAAMGSLEPSSDTGGCWAEAKALVPWLLRDPRLKMVVV